MHPNISFIKFADVKLPELVEVPSKGYVLFGEDNLYPNQLLQKFNKSSKHNAIVLGKVNYITGNGFEQTFEPNKKESLNDLLKKCTIDIEVFGGCYIEIQYNKLGEVGAAYHVPYQKVRSSKDNTQYFVKDWTTSSRSQPEIISAYNPNVKDGKQIIYYKEYRPGLEVYTYPGYIGALNWIETDIEVSKYHLSTVKNGMFSSKLINFNQGVPSPEEQQVVETKFKKKFTGSENAGGIVITFNDDPAKAPTVLDLSNTDLDKHFDLLSKTIQQEIFTGHQVTSPMLFGNRVEGQLGGRSEMRDSYEIFKNTYINDKQRALEQLFTELAGLFGLNYEMKIVPVEPIGFEFSEATIKEVAPKEWILEKLGIDPLKYGEAPVQDSVQNGVQVNESLKNLTGRQWQNISRIIRNFENQKISQEQARLLLKSSLGLTDEEIDIMLSIDNSQEFSSQEQDQLLIFEFSKHGEPKDDFHVIKVKEYFNFADEPTQMETNVLDLVKKDKRITPEVIAKALKIKIEEASTIIQRLTDNGLIEAKQIKHGNDIVTERTLAKPLNEITDQKPRTLEYKIMYSYEGPKDSKNRDFCRQLLELDKFFSRADIETMSRRLGYSVWDRRGGWWTKPNGNHSPSCRHKWVQNFVIRKK